MADTMTNTVPQATRDEVAACTRLLNQQGILGYSGHVSTRLPGGDTLLIQPFDRSRAELEPGDLLVCDMDGAVVEGTPGVRPPSEVFLHTEIYRARPDVNAVAHFHHDLSTTFTLVDGVPLRPMKNHSVRWRSGIPTHADPSHVSSPELGRAVAGVLGPHHAVLIRAHGQIITAEDPRAVLVDSIHFVENAQTMYDAARLGPVRPLTEAEMDAFEREFKRKRHVAKLWDYYVGGGRKAGVLPEGWDLG